MGVLVIDTATAACSVALIDEGQVLAAAHEIVGRGHAERLVPMIEEVVAGHPKPDHILVDCGPGSFTGVRVGLAAARALALGWQATISGFSSLALLAAMAEPDEPIGVAIPGGHGELFVQSFAAAPVRALSTLRSLRPEEAGTVIRETLVAGPGAATLVAARGTGEVLDLLPDAAKAILLPPELTGLPPIPIYGRAPDAKLPA
jgi:tRNA threonylcarbamoyl adenosine modification protein YeaZ